MLCHVRDTINLLTFATETAQTRVLPVKMLSIELFHCELSRGLMYNGVFYIQSVFL